MSPYPISSYPFMNLSIYVTLSDLILSIYESIHLCRRIRSYPLYLSVYLSTPFYHYFSFSLLYTLRRFGIVLEGRNDDELPECMLGAATLCKVSIDNVMEWPF